MAINEACGLWIEQRIQEELEKKGETGVSLREIGRQVSAEIERYFEAKVKPETIRKRAERISGTNVPFSTEPHETPVDTGVQASAPKKDDLRISKENIVKTVASMMEACKTQQAVFQKLAEETGLTPKAIGGRYQRAMGGNCSAMAKKNLEDAQKPTFEVAMKFAKIAVANLEQISNSHHDAKDAFRYVKKWIAKNERNLT